MARRTWVGVATFLVFGHAGSAFAATFPADSAWNALTATGIGIGDTLSDGANNGREVVGDDTNPAAFIYADGNDFFVRIRLDASPLQAPNNLRPYYWGVLIDTDGNFNDYEFALQVDGISEQVVFQQNTTTTGISDPTDVAETSVGSSPYILDWSSAGNVRVVSAPTSFNGDPDFFVDFALSRSELPTGLPPSGPLVFWAGSSNGAGNLNVDIANAFGISVTLAATASDPVDLTGVSNDIDGDGVLNDVDTDPADPTVCADADRDLCDDCAVTSGPPSTSNDGTDTDGDGLCDNGENSYGMASNDVDSDDDGVFDGDELEWDADTDQDNFINALDPDSDGDGIRDGVEMGLTCSHADSGSACVSDADINTTTNPLVADTDDGGVDDGVEDADQNGAQDSGETDPNNPDDDRPCATDADCGDAASAMVCDAGVVCIEGCRGTGGNGCDIGYMCTSTDSAIGTCILEMVEADMGGEDMGTADMGGEDMGTADMGDIEDMGADMGVSDDMGGAIADMGISDDMGIPAEDMGVSDDMGGAIADMGMPSDAGMHTDVGNEDANVSDVEDEGCATATRGNADTPIGWKVIALTLAALLTRARRK